MEYMQRRGEFIYVGPDAAETRAFPRMMPAGDAYIYLKRLIRQTVDITHWSEQLLASPYESRRDYGRDLLDIAQGYRDAAIVLEGLAAPEIAERLAAEAEVYLESGKNH